MVTWNLKSILDVNKIDEMIAELKTKTQSFKELRPTLNENLSTDKFVNIIKLKEELVVLNRRLGGYASLWLSENTSDSKRTALADKINNVSTEVSNETMFFSLWFKELDNADKFIEASGKYKYFLETIRKFKDYTLSEKEEQIINLKDITGSDLLVRLYNMITNDFMYDWKGEQITESELVQKRETINREDRVNAYKMLFKRYQDNEAVLGELFKGIVNDWRNEGMKLRGYKTPISIRNIGQDLPDEAIKSLLKVVKENVGLYQEYFKLKSKITNQKIDRFDLIMPLKDEPKGYDFEKSKQIVLETYKEFSDNFYEKAKKLFDENHIHSDIVKGKSSGAYCSYFTTSITPYVLLNHMNKQNDVFTMAHELGHAIHALCASEVQTNLTFDSILPIAETASIFGEQLLAEHFLKESAEDDKIALLMKLIEKSYATITRQAYISIFEIEVHDKIANGATVEEINKIWLDKLKEQFGDMEIDESFQHEWKWIPHMFHTPFYCYAYAFGNLLVLALYKMYKEQGSTFISKYEQILAAGGSMSPTDIASIVDVDLTSEEFWQKGFDVIREELEELKKLTK